jgi:hypothetical protein
MPHEYVELIGRNAGTERPNRATLLNLIKTLAKMPFSSTGKMRINEMLAAKYQASIALNCKKPEVSKFFWMALR